MTDTTHPDWIDAIEPDDYIIGETGIYEVAETDNSRDKPYRLTIASERSAHADAQTANSGWVSEELISTLGTHVPREKVESTTVEDGDTLQWEVGHPDGSSATATVQLQDDGSVQLASEGLLVPETLPDVLTLKCNIASGNATTAADTDSHD